MFAELLIYFSEVNAKDMISTGALWELVRISRDCSREDIRTLAYRTLTSSPTFQAELRRLRIDNWRVHGIMETLWRCGRMQQQESALFKLKIWGLIFPHKQKRNPCLQLHFTSLFWGSCHSLAGRFLVYSPNI